MSSKLPCGRPLPPSSPPPSETKLAEWQEQLRAYLTKEGLKYTEQRWSIARIILESGGHHDPQGIVAQVKNQYPGIGAATVYRSIKVLVDAGILAPSHQDIQGRLLYEAPDADHHDHIICVDCGHIFEFHDHDIEQMQEKVADRNGFELAGHRHVIHGHCTYLKRKAQRAPSLKK